MVSFAACEVPARSRTTTTSHGRRQRGWFSSRSPRRHPQPVSTCSGVTARGTISTADVLIVVLLFEGFGGGFRMVQEEVRGLSVAGCRTQAIRRNFARMATGRGNGRATTMLMVA